MKTCPTCQRVYSDETMSFCLADGTELLNVTRNIDLDATWRLAPKVEPAPTQAAPQTGGGQPLSTIEYHPELLGTPSAAVASVKPQTGRSVLPWIFAMVVVLALSGIFIAWIVTRARGEKNASQVPAPSPQPSVAENVNSATPTQAQKSDANKNGSKSTSASKKNSAGNAPPVVVLNPSTPTRKTTVKKEGSSTAVVKPEKKKVETPKPTGESFIPVRP